MISKISSGKNGQIVYHFSNGVKLSFIWDWGTYSDNNMARPKDITKPSNETWESTTVEIYSIGDNPNGVKEWLGNKYECGNGSAGYVPVKDIPQILRRADRGTGEHTDE